MNHTPNDTPLPVIAAGKAQIAMTAAVLEMLAAVSRMEATAMAVARALDAVTPPAKETAQ